MDHSPKLKIARAEIEAVLQKHDIAGIVILHTPGFGETFYALNPSYSKLAVHTSTALSDDDIAAIRLRSKLADYNGDREAQRKDLEATANMVRVLADLCVTRSLNLIHASEFIEQATGATHEPATFTPDDRESRH